MPAGTIKKLVSDRGFGFIAAEDGKEYFFHRSSTEGNFDRLQGGEKVSFEIESSPRGHARRPSVSSKGRTRRAPGASPGLLFLSLPAARRDAASWVGGLDRPGAMAVRCRWWVVGYRSRSSTFRCVPTTS